MSLAAEQLRFAARIGGLLFVLLTAGCAGLQCAPLGESPQTGATAAVAPLVAPAAPLVAPVAPAAPPITHPTGQLAADADDSASAQPAGLQRSPPGATPAGTVAVEPTVAPAAASVSRSTGQLAANAAPPVAKAPAKVVASPVPIEQVRKKESVAQGPVKQETSPPLDLKSLETRLKETKAIGVFTKLALKNQVDDLLDQFRAFYQGRLKTTLAELRRPYDLLLVKVLALLQDTDPPLAGAIVASREAIWSILADRARFSAI